MDNRKILSRITRDSFYAFQNEKVGVFHETKSDYNIPIKYDQIIFDSELPIRDKNSDVVAYVRKGNKWGAYCYLVDYHERYSKKDNKEYEQEYVKKRFIAPLFDSIILINNYDRSFETMFFKVSINNKFGILDAFNRKFVIPVIFDNIDKVNINYMEIEAYGEIDGKTCISKGHEVQVLTTVDVKLSDEYKLIRKKIEKRED